MRNGVAHSLREIGWELTSFDLSSLIEDALAAQGGCTFTLMVCVCTEQLESFGNKS